jgi:hypothetical protein
MATKRSKKPPGQRPPAHSRAKSPKPVVDAAVVAESSPARSRAKSPKRNRTPAPPPLIPLQQQLLVFGREGAHALRQMIVAVVVIASIIGLGLGVWSIRPTPAYSSEGLTTGSPFDLTFKVENESPWFELSNLGISCIVDHIRASGLPPTRVEAKDVRFPSPRVPTLQPGESATFTCPFRALIGHPINADPDIVRRSEIYFHAEYDVPFWRSFRIPHDSAHFFFDTRPLPPRWVVVQP